MKTLAVYYSFEGSCRELARIMAGEIGADIEELRPAKEGMPRKGMMKYVTGGKASFLKQTPRLLPLSVNPRDYGLILVGTPVWFWNMAPPVRTFLTQTDWKGLKVALFASHGGADGFTLGAMRSLVEKRGGAVLETSSYRDLRRGKPHLTKTTAAAWARALGNKLNAAKPPRQL